MFTRGAWKLATFPSRSLSIPPPSSLPRHSSSSSSSPNYDWLQEHNLSLSFHSNNQVGLLTLCRPDRRNALSPEMGKGIMKIASNPPSNLRALVVTGEGPVFSAGRDLKASLQHTPEETEEYMHISADSVGALKGKKTKQNKTKQTNKQKISFLDSKNKTKQNKKQNKKKTAFLFLAPSLNSTHLHFKFQRLLDPNHCCHPWRSLWLGPRVSTCL